MALLTVDVTLLVTSIPMSGKEQVIKRKTNMSDSIQVRWMTLWFPQVSIYMDEGNFISIDSSMATWFVLIPRQIHKKLKTYENYILYKHTSRNILQTKQIHFVRL